jgi:xylulose-5-phosphate/fructose-6-phosphate phosphoketolase
VQHLDSTPTRTCSRRNLELFDAYWRAANYLSVGQIYLLDNPLLREPLRAEHVKPRLLGHWGTTPGLNLLYAHMNRVINQRDLNALYVTGPGHGGPGLVANAYLEGTYSEVYSSIGRDEDGLRALFRQFSFPGGIPSHVAPETPGSIHEGGELGYALVHAYGAAFDNPDLLVLCVVGDGEAETGPLAASWHSNKFLNPVTDSAVLPVLHLNGYKIANPTVLARIPVDELAALIRGYGYQPHFVVGDDPAAVHQQLTATLDEVLDDIARIQHAARRGATSTGRPAWPMIVLRTPKGWTGPKEVDGVAVEGTFRAHQVPLAETRANPEHRALLEAWMRSYRPEELFDNTGRLIPELAMLAPRGPRRMSANPHANGGRLLRELAMPDFHDFAVRVEHPGVESSSATGVLGGFLRDIITRNPDRFRIMGPDETASNRPSAVFETTNRAWDATTMPGDDHLAPDGRHRAATRRPSGGLLRHRVSHHHPRSRGDLRGTTPVAAALRDPPLRLPRTVPRLLLPPRRATTQPAAAGPADRPLPPGRGRLTRRRSRRPQRRHHHGLHPAGRPGHGHPLGHRRPRAGALARRARAPLPARGRHRIGAALRTDRAGRHRRHA